jgi:lysyl-tRNA synthetase class 2
MSEDNKLIIERKNKLQTLREQGNPFVNDFKPQHLNAYLIENYDNLKKEELAEKKCRGFYCWAYDFKTRYGKIIFCNYYG